jgi:hypothetical protein
VIHGAERFNCPIEGDTTTTQFDQDYMVNIADYAPLAEGTVHGTHASHYLIKESAVEDLGGGIGKFTRTYSMVPADRNEYETFAYNFIGFWPSPGIYGMGGTGRDRFTRTVVSRLAHHYAITTPPIVIRAQDYFVTGSDTLKLDWLFPAAYTYHSSDQDGSLTVETYQGWVTSGTHEFVAEDSRISRWQGNIYERVTRYIYAL